MAAWRQGRQTAARTCPQGALLEETAAGSGLLALAVAVVVAVVVVVVGRALMNWK